MKALQFDGTRVKLAEVERPQRAGEALVRVTMAGICNTDLEIVRGYASFTGTLGHEFVGVVEVAPDASLLGRRVVGEINAGCGDCDLCRRGDPRHCRRRTALGIHGRDGAFAEYLNLPAQNLRPVPENVSDRQAVFTEPIAAACEILDQIAIRVADRVAVIGDGKLGQLIARVLASTGCSLTLIGKYPGKLELAARAGIETVTLDALGPASRFDVVVEASGSAAGLRLALDLVRSRGAIVLKSTFHGEVSLDTSRLVVDEIRLIGSRCGRFEPALALLTGGAVEVESLISREFNLAEGAAAIAEAARPGVMKVLLTM
jgi:threonine dehydrogenase-like Zn-dependent dehydrogenase